MELTSTETDSSNPQSEKTVAVEASETEGDFIEVDFSELTGFADEDEGGEEAPAVETASKEEPPEETPVAEEEAAVEVKTESESEKPPESKEPEVEEPKKEATAPEQPEVKMPTKEELEGMYKEHREKTLPTLEGMFQLSDEEAAALDEQPSKMIPKLAGQMMYDTMMSTYNAVLTAMPSVVGKLIDASNKAKEAESVFYGQWPDLNKPEAAPVVQAAVTAYRSANPRAKLEDVVKNAGVMAMIQLGLDPMAKREAPASTKPAVKTVPAKPAAPRGQPPTPPKREDEEVNEFAELAELFARDNS